MRVVLSAVSLCGRDCARSAVCSKGARAASPGRHDMRPFRPKPAAARAQRSGVGWTLARTRRMLGAHQRGADFRGLIGGTGVGGVIDGDRPTRTPRACPPAIALRNALALGEGGDEVRQTRGPRQQGVDIDDRKRCVLRARRCAQVDPALCADQDVRQPVTEPIAAQPLGVFDTKLDSIIGIGGAAGAVGAAERALACPDRRVLGRRRGVTRVAPGPALACVFRLMVIGVCRAT